MATPNAGTKITVLNPWAYVAPLGTILPARSLALGAPWPTGWIPVGVTQNGWQVTTVNPKVDIPSDELGTIDVLPSGADTVNITGQPKRPRNEFWKWINGFTRATLAAITGTGAAPEADVYVPDPDEENSFMFAFEGIAQAGSLYPDKRLVRFVAFNVDQTENPQNHGRSHGADALLQPTMTMRCLPEDPANLLLPTDIPTSAIDPKNKKAAKCAWMAIKTA